MLWTNREAATARFLNDQGTVFEDRRGRAADLDAVGPGRDEMRDNARPERRAALGVASECGGARLLYLLDRSGNAFEEQAPRRRCVRNEYVHDRPVDASSTEARVSRDVCRRAPGPDDAVGPMELAVGRNDLQHGQARSNVKPTFVIRCDGGPEHE
jgi:hypothetical protein